MGKFDNIAILTDLDKTFLADGSKMVQRNVDAIEYFKSEGGIFTISTGRMHHGLENTVIGVEKLLNAPALMCNGTYFYDFSKREVSCETFIDAELVIKTVQFVHNLNMVRIIRGSARNGYLVESPDGNAAMSLRNHGINAIVCAPYEKWDSENIYKLSFVDEAQTLIELEEILKKEFAGRYEYNRSSPIQLELQTVGVNKAKLIAPFKELYSKQGRELTVYACGDNENDIAMLRAADVALCPSNAIDAVKAICHKCLCSNNDGVIADLIYSL